MFYSFSKYHGAGNDFILIDDRAGDFPSHDEHWIRELCHRTEGIGADGLILLQLSDVADFRMRVFNSDGREVEMCGNGARCLIRFIHALGIKKEFLRIQAAERIISGRLIEERVSISLGKPQVIHWNLSLPLENFTAHILNTGVPHAVIFVPDVAKIDVAHWGRAIRFFPLFAPEGVNVNFAMLATSGALHMRTYERGVEKETQACGTGAAAVAMAAMGHYRLQNPIRIYPTSQIALEVNVAEEIELIGSAERVFEGRIHCAINSHSAPAERGCVT